MALLAALPIELRLKIWHMRACFARQRAFGHRRAEMEKALLRLRRKWTQWNRRVIRGNYLLLRTTIGTTYGVCIRVYQRAGMPLDLTVFEGRNNENMHVVYRIPQRTM